MPCQVSWQSVAIKLQPSVHTLGAEAAAADGAFIGMTSAAQASTPQEAPPAAIITAAKNAELCTASLPGSTCTIVRWYKVGRQHGTGAIYSDAREFRSEWPPRHSLRRRPTGSAAQLLWGDRRSESASGHSRRFDPAPATSGLAP